MFRVSLDNHKYYYETLEEACLRFYQYLKTFGLEQYLTKGVFEYTSIPLKNNIPKLKKYILKLDTSPKINLEIFKMDKEPLQPELLFYFLNKLMEKS